MKLTFFYEQQNCHDFVVVAVVGGVGSVDDDVAVDVKAVHFQSLKNVHC